MTITDLSVEQVALALAGGAGVLLLVQIGLAWRLLHLARIVSRSEERIGSLSGALSLLTETSEAGFRAMAMEIERLGSGGSTRRRTRVSMARMAASARTGRSIPEIAAAEQVSEGEVRLRLHLAEQARADRVHDRARRSPKGEPPDGALRD
jgi:hypothetical protein